MPIPNFMTKVPNYRLKGAYSELTKMVTYQHSYKLCSIVVYVIKW